MEAERAVSELEIDQFAESMHAEMIPISVMTNQNVDYLFNRVIEKSWELAQKLEVEKQNNPTVGAGAVGNVKLRAFEGTTKRAALKRQKNNCC